MKTKKIQSLIQKFKMDTINFPNTLNPANICWTCQQTCLEDVFSLTILLLPRRLEDVLKTSCKDILKTS